MCLLLAISHLTRDFGGAPHNLHTEYHRLSTLSLKLNLTEYSALFIFETLSRENMGGKVSYLLMYTSKVSSHRGWHIISIKKIDRLSKSFPSPRFFSMGQRHLPKLSE